LSSIKKMHTKENCFFFVCLTVQRSHNNVCKYDASDNVYYCWFLFVQRGAVLNSSALSSHPASSVSPKCRSRAHFQPETLWPHHRRAHQSSLAPRARANYIQGGDADVHVSYTAWIRTILLGVVIHMCRRHAAPTQAQVCLHWTAWRSDLSSVNCRRSCLSCCWSKGVECDVTSASSLSVFKNRLKTYLFRRCYEWHFLFLVIITPPEQWSLQVFTV